MGGGWGVKMGGPLRGGKAMRGRIRTTLKPRIKSPVLFPGHITAALLAVGVFKQRLSFAV